jgi:hypothetical protein
MWNLGSNRLETLYYFTTDYFSPAEHRGGEGVATCIVEEASGYLACRVKPLRGLLPQAMDRDLRRLAELAVPKQS